MTSENDQEERALVSIDEEKATAARLYGGDDEIAAFGYAVQKVAPWAKDMKPTDIGLIVRRSLAMGLDPLNPHEVQIWRDPRGNVQFQLAYTLLAEWVRRFHGQHTEPQYRKLNELELEEEGLLDGDLAYKVKFIMIDDIPRLKVLIGAKFQPEEARLMVTVTGTGSATATEMKKAGDYFAPKGRTAAWKVQKRALTDAYRRKFGTPTRDEIMELRRATGRDRIQPGDWIVAEGDRQIAELAANTRESKEQIEQMSPEEVEAVIDENRNLLRGTKEEREWDADTFDAAEGGAPAEGHSAATPVLERPADASTVRGWLRERGKWTKGDADDWSDARRQPDDEQEPPPEKLVQRIAALMGKALARESSGDADLERHSVLIYAFGVSSTKLLTLMECNALAKWLEASPMGYIPSGVAAEECRLMLREALKDAGQEELPLEVD